MNRIRGNCCYFVVEKLFNRRLSKIHKRVDKFNLYNVMKNKILLMIIAVGVLFSTACVKNEVPEEVQKLREEQLNLAKAMTELKNQEAIKMKFTAQLEEYKAKVKEMELAVTAAQVKQKIAQAQELETKALNEIEKAKVGLVNDLESKRLTAIDTKNQKLALAYTKYNNAYSDYVTESEKYATYTQDVVKAEFDLKQAEIVLQGIKDGLVSKKEAAKYDIETAEQTLLKKKEDLALKEALLKTYKESQEYKDAAAALEKINKEIAQLKAEQKVANAKQIEAKKNWDIDKAKLNEANHIINAMDADGVNTMNRYDDELWKGYAVVIKGYEETVTKEEAKKAEAETNVDEYQKKVDEYQVEMDKLVKAKKDYDSQIEAKQPELRRLKEKLDDALEAADANKLLSAFVGSVQEKYGYGKYYPLPAIGSSSLGYTIGTGDADTTTLSGLIHVPVYGDNTKMEYYVDVQTGADAGKKVGQVSAKIGAFVKGNKILADLNEAYKPYGKVLNAIKDLKDKRAKLEKDYNFYARELSYGSDDLYKYIDFSGSTQNVNAKKSVKVKLEKTKEAIEKAEKAIKEAKEKIAKYTAKKEAIQADYDKAIAALDELKEAEHKTHAAYLLAKANHSKVSAHITAKEQVKNVLKVDGGSAIAALAQQAEQDVINAKQAVEQQNEVVEQKKAAYNELDYDNALVTQENNVAQLKDALEKAKVKLANQEQKVKDMKARVDEHLKAINAILGKKA